MIDLKISAEVRIILFQRVIAVRADGNYFFHAIAVHYFDIGLRLRLEEILIAAAHRRITAAPFLVAQNAEAHARCLQDFRESGRNFFAAVVKRTGAADVK